MCRGHPASIDIEVARLLREAGTTAIGLLREHRDVLDKVIALLREHENVDGAELAGLACGPPPGRRTHLTAGAPGPPTHSPVGLSGVRPHGDARTSQAVTSGRRQPVRVWNASGSESPTNAAASSATEQAGTQSPSAS